MKKKLFTLLTLLLCLCSGAWATSYIPTTVKTITTTQNFIIDDLQKLTTDNTWFNIPLVKMQSKTGVPVDDDFATSKSVEYQCLQVKTDGGNYNSEKRVIHMLVTGITGVKAIGQANSGRGFQIGATEYTEGMSENTSMNIVAGNSSANNPVSYSGLSAKKTYIISILAYSSDTYLYAVRFTAGSTNLEDPGLSVSPSSKTLSLGGTQQISASATSGGTISYQSNNTNVATVTNAGLITAVGVGNATITTNVAATGSYDTDSKQTTIIVKPADLNITKYATFNGSAVSSPENYFTVTNGGDYNTKFAGSYGGTNYTSGLKFTNSTSISFTTTSTCDLIVVQSLWSNQLIKIDGTTFSRDYDTNTYYDDETNKVRVYTIKNLEAGSHSITRNSEFGMLYIGVTESLAPSLSVSPSTSNEFSYVAGNGPSAAQSFTVTGSNLTSTITATLSNTEAYEMRIGESEYGAGPLTNLESGAAVQVRLKSGLAKGDTYNGNLTFSSTGADNQVVALAGSVTAQTYAVTYDLNGASGDVPTQAATEEGGKFNLAAAPTRTCYTFNGWKCNINDVTYNAGDEYTMTAAPTTFTAQWTANYSTSLDFAEVVLAKINDGTETPAIETFLAGGNMVGETLGSGSVWETGSDWGGSIKTGYLGYKLKNSGAKLSFLAPAGKLVTIVLGSIAANVTLSKNGTTSTINSKSGDDAETIVTPFVTGEDMLVSLTTSGSGTVTLKKIIISDYETVTKRNDRTYGTYITTQALDFTGTDMEAYIAKGLNGAGTFVTIDKVAKVPAGTPIIVKTAEQTIASVNVPVTSTATAADVEGNLLIAGDGTTTWNGTAGYTYYYLAGDEFHKGTSGTLQTGKAYLKVPGDPASAKAMTLFIGEGETTGISNLNVNDNANIDANAPMYNLAGQKVGKNYKGIVIVNGKKVVRK